MPALGLLNVVLQDLHLQSDVTLHQFGLVSCGTRCAFTGQSACPTSLGIALLLTAETAGLAALSDLALLIGAWRVTPGTTWLLPFGHARDEHPMDLGQLSPEGLTLLAAGRGLSRGPLLTPLLTWRSTSAPGGLLKLGGDDLSMKLSRLLPQLFELLASLALGGLQPVLAALEPLPLLRLLLLAGTLATVGFLSFLSFSGVGCR